MNTLVNRIAKIDKKERFDAICSILSENNIPYRIQSMGSWFAMENVMGNIIVHFQGEGKKTVFCAHYDNVPGTPGANDNAAACAILLSLITHFKENLPSTNLEFVFTDLEERGFVGSSTYVSANLPDIEMVINLDMCGMGNNIVYSQYNMNPIQSSKIDAVMRKRNATEVGMLPPSDACKFDCANIPTLFVINSTDHDVEWFINYARGKTNGKSDFSTTMHRPNDLPSTLNYDQMNIIKDTLQQIIEK